MRPTYRPETLANFADPAVRAEFEAALRKVESQLGRDYPLWIDGKEIVTEAKITRVNPASIQQVVGRTSKGTAEHVEMAMKACDRVFPSWSRKTLAERARYLYKAATILRRRRHEFSAWMVKEVGKNWAEADGDTCEAIDFLEFYGQEAERYGRPQGITAAGVFEENEVFWIPLGTGIVIPPWNFPLAILVGMTTAALVTGNPVILKPASASVVIAAKFVEAMREAGIPDGVLNFLPGSGGEIGNRLIDHPRTRFISFTGSMDVGLEISRRAAIRHPGQLWIKRVIAEMGGKDTIVVDDSADTDAAIQGIVTAAYGFQGQKCSACSRAVLTPKVYDRVLEGIVAKVKAITVGDTTKYENYLGPVVDKGAWEKIQTYLEAGKREGKLAAGGGTGPAGGWFIQPSVYADIPATGRLSLEEIFGPVLAVIRAKDFDDALAIANNTEYGLTGSLFSRNREHLERARREFHVGNLYLNRKCTGAIVDVQPFGGFNMSGTDSKAGGREYLAQFMQMKAVTEAF